MTITQPPETMTLDKVKALRNAFGWFYDLEKDKPFVDKNIGYKFEDVTKFVDFLYFNGIPEKTSAKHIGITLERWFEILSQTQSNQTEAPVYQTTVNERLDEPIFKEAEKREAQIKETQENARLEVERAQEKLREIKARNDEILKRLEEQKGKKLYVEIKSPVEEQFTKEEALDFDNYKEYLKSVKPDEIPEAVELLANEMESRIGETLKNQGLDEEDIKLVTENAAVEIIDNLIKSDDSSYVPPTHSVAVANSFIRNPEEIKKIAKDENTQNLIKENARFTSPETLLQGYSRTVAEAAFGEKFASRVFGPKPEKLTVSISETPQPTTAETYTPYTAFRSAQMSLENHDQNLEELKQNGLEEGKKFLVRDARSLIRQRLELIHPQSTAGKFLQSNKGDYLLRAFGVGPQDGLSLVEKVAFNYGIPITAGVKTALWAKATTQTAISIANTGGVMQMEAFLGGAAVSATTKVAAKTGIKAAISTTLASIGASIPVPVLNLIAAAVGWIGGELLGKFFEKYGPQIKKFFKEVLGPLLLVGGGIMFGAPVLGLAAGGLAFGVARGATLAGIGAGIWGFFAMLGGAFAMTIATPIIVTLLVLPPLVAFIMLVINNSAYMVPPDSEYSRPPLPGIIPGGGLVSICTETDETGPEITDSLAAKIQNGVVNLLPETVWGRRDGICIKPTMIIMHWSGGANDDPEGNLRTYETLVQRGLSCQLATDTNDTWLMEKFFEKEVEFPACAKQWNTYSINNEMAGSYFLENPPPPNLQELELAYDATCKVMEQYDLPWSQIYGHYHVPNSGKIDPGRDFLEKVFIPEIKNRCPNEQNEPPTNQI